MAEQALFAVPPGVDPDTGEIDPTKLTPEEQAQVLAIRMEKLTAWYTALQAAEKAKPLIKFEQDLRKEVGRLWFPTPREGANTVKLEGGWQLKYTYPIERKVDEAALTTLKQTFVEGKLPVDKLVEWKPSLVKDEYNQLTTEEKELFDQCLIVKPGSVSLELSEDKKSAGRRPRGA